ncbi:hypothetical protein OHS33_15565 [Streptomyces sp. NBC_00536]|uniref:hypothetical protein n=1 Tax=Streptomyces sp. NBC_00536 TaxID=2975769 RepID=UPI002E81E1B5|nr:hypothetical protein [Streptomyces sp. NBC_00536]WUC79622.1 hypothetical protein OHS33_15565 [Streptomyces sp. NBC_00536]
MAMPLVAPVPNDIRAKLAALGTRWEYLHPALYAGEAARRTATPNHPANTAGTRAYQEHVRLLREEHIRHEGWKRLLHDHLETVCNPQKTLAIATMVGDSATGIQALHPTNLHKRGAATERAAEANLQPALFPTPVGPHEAVLDEDEARALKTWFLVSYRVEIEDAVRIHSELSLPVQVERGFVAEWALRIPLPVIKMDGIERPDEDGPDEIDIPVEFR